MLERIVFSEIIWSTCFNLKISAFFNIFNATNSFVALFLAKRTLPKEPGIWWNCEIEDNLEKKENQFPKFARLRNRIAWLLSRRSSALKIWINLILGIKSKVCKNEKKLIKIFNFYLIKFSFEEDNKIKCNSLVFDINLDANLIKKI